MIDIESANENDDGSTQCIIIESDESSITNIEMDTACQIILLRNNIDAASSKKIETRYSKLMVSSQIQILKE